MNLKKGFTLIELLVVIAIIGILSGIVLTSLGASRDKAKDARIISNAKGIRTVLELGFNGSKYVNLGGPIGSDSLGSVYWGPAPALAPQINDLINDTSRQGGSITLRVKSVGPGNYNVTTYAIYGKLVSPAVDTYFCIDSAGNVNPKTNDATQVTCPPAP